MLRTLARFLIRGAMIGAFVALAISCVVVILPEIHVDVQTWPIVSTWDPWLQELVSAVAVILLECSRGAAWGLVVGIVFFIEKIRKEGPHHGGPSPKPDQPTRR